jgi:hypothetical protein
MIFGSTSYLPVTLVLATAVSAAVGCVEPTNPCDPAADAETSAQGTKLTGRVVDVDGEGLAGIVVTIEGSARGVVSGADGGFVFDSIGPSASGYVLRALPAAPDVGGTKASPPVACLQTVDTGDLVVVRPRAAPEVELVKAVSSTSLLVAFGAGTALGVEDDSEAAITASTLYVDGGTARSPEGVVSDCRARNETAPRTWRVQVRPPFDTWHDGVVSAFPWMAGDAALAAATVAEGGAHGRADDVETGGVLFDERVEDVCGMALCAQFSYLEETLSDARARCALVVGYKQGDEVRGLDAYGTYEVRVLSETRVDDDVSENFALPSRVVSQASGAPGQTSLVPAALLPLVDAGGAALDARTLEVQTIVAVAGSRFALVEAQGMRVLGGGDDVLAANGESETLQDDLPQGALATDVAAAERMTDDLLDDGDTEAVALATLPAGSWLRVVKMGDAGAMVEKVYVGATSSAAQEGPGAAREIVESAEARVPFSPSGTGLGSLRGFSYLVPTDTSLVTAGTNPRDAYVMLYERGFVLLENGREDDLVLARFAEASSVEGGFAMSWADPVSGEEDAEQDVDLAERGSAFGGRCADVRTESPDGARQAFGATDAGSDLQGQKRTAVAVCYDWANAHAEAVDFRDVEVLEGTDVRHLIADATNDRVIVLPHAALTGQVGALAANTVSVSVGRQPVALSPSRVLDCGLGQHERVMLVANAGSNDVSVLGERDGAVQELAVLSLSFAPVGFVDDREGPTCSAPFVWAIAAQGELLPIDMRGAPSVPLCDGAPCAISSRGRATTGAVAHLPDPEVFAATAYRAVVGGQGLLGELGFFRPGALRGAAYDFGIGSRPSTSR